LIDLILIKVNPTLPLESETHITQLDEPLVDQVVESIPYLVDSTLIVENEINSTLVLLVTSDSSTHGGIIPICIEPHQVVIQFPLIGIE